MLYLNSRRCLSWSNLKFKKRYLGHIQVHGLVFLTKHVLVYSLLLSRNSYASFYTVRFKTPFWGFRAVLEIVCCQSHFQLKNLK